MPEPSHLLTAVVAGTVRVTPEHLMSLPKDYDTFDDLLLELAAETLEGPEHLYADRILHWQVIDTRQSVDTSGKDIIFAVEVRYHR